MKKYRCFTILSLALLIVLQPFAAEWFSIKGVHFNFVIFGVMMSAFGKTKKAALLSALITGMAYDMIYSPWIGKTAIVMMAGVLCVFAVDKFVYRENVPALALFFFLATYITESINSMLEIGFFDYFAKFVFVQKTVLGLAVYSAGLAVLTGIVFFIRALGVDRRLVMGRGGG